MFSVNVLGVTYAFDAKGYTAALKRYIENETRLAAREFAHEALLRIPIRTGFVAGAFGTLVDLLGPNARLNPIVAFGYREFYYPPGSGKIFKTPTAGRQFATPSSDVFQWNGATFSFTYEVDITYFSLNDLTPGHAPTAPWGAFEAGQRAFERRMAQAGINYNVPIQPYLIPIPVKKP